MALQRGNYAPIPTFFNDDDAQSIDVNTSATHALNIVKAGVVGIVCQGSTAEWVTLSTDEKRELTRAVRNTLNSNGYKSTPIIAGISAQSTQQAIELSKLAKEDGAQAVLSLPPTYFAASLTQSALTSFYDALATHSPLPVLIYSFPSVSNGLVLSADSIISLAQHTNIIGIKQTDHDIGKMVRLGDLHNSNFYTLAGASNYLTAALAVGAIGSITGAANYAPELVTAVQRAHDGGDTEKALQLQRKLAALEDEVGKGGIPAIKLASAVKYGYKHALPRHPVPACTDAVRASITEALKKV